MSLAPVMYGVFISLYKVMSTSLARVIFTSYSEFWPTMLGYVVVVCLYFVLLVVKYT